MKDYITLDSHKDEIDIIGNNPSENTGIKALIFAVIITMPLTNAFSISALVNLTNVLLVITFLYLVLSKKILIKFSVEMILMYLFAILSILSMFKYNDKTMIEIRGYLYIPIIFIIAAQIFYNVKISHETMIKYFYKAWILAFVFGFFELLLVNFTNIPIQNYIFRYRVEIPLMENMRGVLPTRIYRMRSFFAEPGFYAMYLNSMTPFFLYHSKKCFGRVKVRILIIPLIITAYILSFSTAGLLIAVITFIILILINSVTVIEFSKTVLLNKNKVKIIVLGILGILFLFLAWITVLEGSYFKNLIEYRLFDSSSVDMRTSRALDGLYVVKDSLSNDLYSFLFGHGIGYYQSIYKTTSISSLVTMMVEIGFVGLFTLFAIFLSLIIKTFKRAGDLKYYFLFSIFSTILHLLIVPNFYFPHIWIVLAFIWSLSFINKRLKK